MSPAETVKMKRSEFWTYLGRDFGLLKIFASWTQHVYTATLVVHYVLISSQSWEVELYQPWKPVTIPWRAGFH